MTEAKGTVLVTGACGFIGTWVLRELVERGAQVVALDLGDRPERWERVMGCRSRDIVFERSSLLNQESLGRVFRDQKITHVIHLAALLTPACQSDPWEGFQVNVLGTMSLLEQIRMNSSKIRGLSYASSVAVFGDESDSKQGIPGAENHPMTFYGAFKRSVELITEQYWRHFQIASLGIRPQVAYGPEREVGLTAGPSLAARAAAKGEPFCIRYTGIVGYDYVEDVARAFVDGALATPSGAQVVDLAGETSDICGVIDALKMLVPGAKITVEGPPIPAHAPPVPNYISAVYSGWKTTSLRDGLRRTVEFYRN